jgi:acyl carrier protein
MELQDNLKRCPPGTFEAALLYLERGDASQVRKIVLGVIHRFLEPEYRPLLEDPREDLSFIDDLRVDSLTMMEIVILTEETLGVGLDNSRLKEIQKLGDLYVFIDETLGS